MTPLAHAVYCSIQIENFKEELETLPARVREIESELQTLESDYQNQKIEWENLEKDRKRLEAEFREETDKLNEKELRLNSIKTQKEYQAVVKEISVSKTTQREREQKIARVKELQSEIHDRLAPREANLEKLRQQLSEEKSQIQGTLEELQNKVTTFTEKLELALNALAPEVRSQYQVIASRMQPPAALVVEGTCQECFINLPPQMYIELRRKQIVHTCPSCNRLLYFEEPQQEIP